MKNLSNETCLHGLVLETCLADEGIKTGQTHRHKDIKNWGGVGHAHSDGAAAATQ